MLSSELIHSALRSMPDAMVIIDAAGSIVFVNERVKAVFGYDTAELVGQSIECLLPQRFRSRHVTHRSDYARFLRARPMGTGLALFARRKDATEFPVEISLSPIVDGDVVLVAAAIRDVTDRQRIQVELQQARQTAERATRAKSRFLATASHDLRQPLQTLALLNGALRRIAAGPEITATLLQQEQAIGTLSRLLNALLDISKLESGAIQPEPVDFSIAGLFEELRCDFEQLAINKGLDLHVEPGTAWVRSDPALVSQILRNLLSNAIKYTRQGRVILRGAANPAGVSVEVQDSGIGIAPERVAHIYDDFYQVGVPANAARDGYGLGLSIVQRVVRLLGLEIEVRSQVDRGTTFSLQLPAAHARIPSHATTTTLPRKSTGNALFQPHILILEDDPAVRDALSMLLGTAGFRISVTTSAQDARQLADAQPDIDLLVTDYHLSGRETGADVARALRHSLGADLKVILMSGDTSLTAPDSSEDPRLRLACKPVNADDLLGLVDTLLAVPPAATRNEGTFPEFRREEATSDADLPQTADLPQAAGHLAQARKQRRDEEHERRLQERLTHVSRLATVGEIAAGVAHELNQPLAAVANYAQACERMLTTPHADLTMIRNALQEITTQTLRAGAIIQRLRSLAHHESAVRVPTDINALIGEVRDLMLSGAEASAVHCQFDLAQDLPPVWAAPDQIQQVLLNLFRNALDSLDALDPSDSGRSEPALRTVVVGTRTLPDSQIEIRLCDTGSGVSAPIVDQMFDPFVTTKSAGTGLGLAISRTIVQAHGGALDYRPNTPRGACFALRLPSMPARTP